MTEHIDAHHHFWRYDPAEYGWISDEMRELRRDFLVADLNEAMIAADVQSAITVQARQTLEETHWLLHFAGERRWLRGVIGWAPIASAEFPSCLEKLRASSKLKGLRYVLQDEPDDSYMLQPDFNRGISALSGTGLIYEKISGLATEADWKTWTVEDLRPYFEIALEYFGPERLIAGSDWPVCTVATSYTRWWQTLRELSAALSQNERSRFLGGNAMRVYSLEGESE